MTSPLDSPLSSVRTPQARAAASAVPRVVRRYRGFAEFDARSQALAETWLSPRERAELAAWRDERRRRAWLLSRAVAKQLVADVAEPALEPRQIEILSRDAAGRVNRPRVWCDGVERRCSLSISHSQRGVLAAMTDHEHTALGVDLADCDRFSDSFVELWFTPDERTWFHETQSTGIACFVWAAKEALYKACNDGESFAPREVEVLSSGQCSYRGAPLNNCRLQSWNVDGHLAVLATVASSRASIQSLV